MPAGRADLPGSRLLVALQSDRQVDGAADAWVSAAAAQHARHRQIDIFIGRLWSVPQQGCGRHDLPGLAIPTLSYVERVPGAHERVAAVCCQALDSQNAPA